MANAFYHQNLRAQELRQHGTVNSWKFGHTSDANAEALASAIAALLASQETSLTKQVNLVLEATPPPVGSRQSVAVLTFDATSAVYRLNLRNLQPTALLSDLGLLFTGAAGGTFGLTALGAPPANPLTLSAIASVSATIRTLPS